jgi:hypothetical protein
MRWHSSTRCTCARRVAERSTRDATRRLTLRHRAIHETRRRTRPPRARPAPGLCLARRALRSAACRHRHRFRHRARLRSRLPAPAPVPLLSDPVQAGESSPEAPHQSNRDGATFGGADDRADATTSFRNAAFGDVKGGARDAQNLASAFYEGLTRVEVPALNSGRFLYPKLIFARYTRLQ